MVVVKVDEQGGAVILAKAGALPRVQSQPGYTVRGHLKAREPGELGEMCLMQVGTKVQGLQ